MSNDKKISVKNKDNEMNALPIKISDWIDTNIFAKSDKAVTSGNPIPVWTVIE